MREEKKDELACVDYVADESDRSGMRAVIRVKKDADIEKLLAYLYKYTDLEVTFEMCIRDRPSPFISVIFPRPYWAGRSIVFSIFSAIRR